jgi:thiol-disulfide isomerase/thioredoxin
MLRPLALAILIALAPALARAEILGMQVERAVSEDEMKTSLGQIDLVDEKGAPLDLKGLMANGKPTFVSLWAHWCPNCTSEVPGYKAIAKACANHWNVVFVSARPQDFPKDVAKFRSYGLPWSFYTVANTARTDPRMKKIARAFVGETVEGGVVTPLHYFIAPGGGVEAIIAGRMDFTERDRLEAYCSR